MSLTLARPGWRARLARPVRLQNGAVIKSLFEARAYVLQLDEDDQSRSVWQCAAARLIQAADGTASVEDATIQMELALLIAGRLNVGSEPESLAVKPVKHSG